MPNRCAWCCRFGATATTYQLHRDTGVFTRDLCPVCAGYALAATARAIPPDPPICVECGNDHATDGLLVCLECAEALGHDADLYPRPEGS